LISRISNIDKVSGIAVYHTRLLLPGSGICLPGIGIFIHSDIPDSFRLRLIQHEFGHFLDYKYGLNGDRMKWLGSHLLGFYVRIGVPSMLNLLWGFNRFPAFSGDHRRFWTEIRANRLAQAHFGDTLDRDYERYFPLV
jgi:hypothetical protein